MQTAELRHKVTFQRVTEADDTFGAPAGTWTDLHSDVPAGKAAGKREERLEAARLNVTAPVVFRTRFIAGITEKDRILHGEDGETPEVYEISSVVTLGRREGLEITARLIK